MDKPQNNTPQNNERQNPTKSRSWIRRHPIITGIVIIVLLIFVMPGFVKYKKGKATEDASKQACNNGDVVACINSCKLNHYDETCDKACLLGNDWLSCHDACKNHGGKGETCEKEVALLAEESTNFESKIADGSACHISEWRVTKEKRGVFEETILSNFSWTHESISIPMGTSLECATVTGTINRIQTQVELGERPDPRHFIGFSKTLLPCAKEIDSKELQEVAKKCNDKWF